MKNNDKERDPYKPSPIPKHLTPEERERWEKDLEWEEQEKERRRREGLYGRRKFKRRRGRSRKPSNNMKPFHEM